MSVSPIGKTGQNALDVIESDVTGTGVLCGSPVAPCEAFPASAARSFIRVRRYRGTIEPHDSPHCARKPIARTRLFSRKWSFPMPDTNGSKRLDWLRRQRESAMADIEAIGERAVADDRDLEDSEEKTCEARRSRILELDDDIKVEADLVERSATYSGLVSHIGSASPSQRIVTVERTVADSDEQVYKTPGEYLSDFCSRSDDSAVGERARTRFNRYLQRAIANQTTVQNPGLLPTPILAPVFSEAIRVRPAIEAATLRPLPGSGKTFQRPRINQHTLAGLQTAEKTELPSRQMLIDPLTVTKATYGGAVNLSWQDRDWTEPAIMDMLVSDLAASYAQATDAAFCTYLDAQVTANQALATPDGAGVLGAIFAATGTIFGATNAMADTLWIAPNVWGALGSLVDTTGRQLFPTVNPVNALGSLGPTTMQGSIGGIRIAVDKNLPAGTAIIGNSSFVEVYETVGGQVSAIEPSIMGTTVAFYGYAAWLVLDPKAFVNLTGVPTLPLATGTSDTGGGSKSYAAKPSK